MIRFNTRNFPLVFVLFSDNLISLERCHPVRHYAHRGEPEHQTRAGRPHARLLRGGEYLLPQVQTLVSRLGLEGGLFHANLDSCRASGPVLSLILLRVMWTLEFGEQTLSLDASVSLWPVQVALKNNSMHLIRGSVIPCAHVLIPMLCP